MIGQLTAARPGQAWPGTIKGSLQLSGAHSTIRRRNDNMSLWTSEKKEEEEDEEDR